MSACSPDGNGQIVPLAIGIAYVEDESSWSFFLSLLKQSIPAINSCGISVVHDREKGLHNAQLNILPLSVESICVFHLEKM
jgi:MULE transposase domain